ncbi:AhpC/TSA family protein [Ancylomarina subtilis]|uniref:AhpC/TSA family protein n=1 Tax=Ancylomarina subtilis TaxID=1639035 RepID=A0A4Q7VC99_9BACT|nr:redoxin domain-containing protein [Ancylomarina subtilis]RZT92462.1 AhpC/TSA family protein [Ancylomarina subtilis]
MKKILALIGIASIICGMLILTTYKAIQVKARVKKIPKKIELSELPEFEFENTKGGNYSYWDIETDKSVLIIHFSPKCDMCDMEAKILFNYYSEFQNSEILMVSKSKKFDIKKFAKKHQLESFPNIQFLKYQEDQFEEIFGTQKLPAILIFDTQLKLLKKIEEAVTVKTLVKYTRAANDR